ASATSGPVGIELLDAKLTKGLKEGMVLTERGGINFSGDGSKIFLGVAPPAPPPADKDKEAAKDAPKQENVVVELWHWKADFIQPRQKVRVQQKKTRTYSAVSHIREKNLAQLADKSVPVVVPPHHGNVALGSDDQPYRYLVAFDGNYADYFAVNLADGNRKLVR